MLDNLGNHLGYPVTAAGDFNCDLLQKAEHAKLGFTILKYDPTIHTVVWNFDRCIDFFAYKNCFGNNVMATVNDISARLDKYSKFIKQKQG